MSNSDIAELLQCSSDHVTKLLNEISEYIQIKNPQTRYRKIFYSGENNGVDSELLRPNGLSKKDSTPSFRTATPSFRPATPAKTTDIIEGNVYNTLSSDSVEYGLAKLLLDCIRSRKADYRGPNLQAWAKHVDYMIRIDHRTPERIRAVIEWCQQDDFWQNNILSTSKLREQFDKLELKMSKSGILKRQPQRGDPDWLPSLAEGEAIVAKIMERRHG